MPRAASSPSLDRRASALFQKLKKITRRVSSEPSPERAHQLRTTSRRIETLLAAAGKRPGRAKLLKQLSRLRRRAGKLRDIDVQMAALSEIMLETAVIERTRLKRYLQKARKKREKKLIAAAEAELANGLTTRLKDIARDLGSHPEKVPPRKEYTVAALDEFATLVRDLPSLNEDTLHGFRVACKRVRYMVETSDENPMAERVVTQLKRIQDAIGDWHDCVTLIETAESAVSTPHSPLLTVLHSRARAKFIEALRITAQAKTELLQMRSNVPSRKQPESIHADGVRDLKYGTR